MPQPSAPDPWDTCPPGELSRMVDAVRSQRRRQSLVQAGVVAVALLVGAGLGASLAYRQQSESNQLGGIACKRVQQLGAQYLAGALDPDLAGKVRHHLTGCAHCRQRYEQLRQGAPTSIEDAPASQTSGAQDSPVVALLR